MELPALTSTEDAYWYLITIIILLSLLSALYIAAVILGYLPDLPRLLSAHGVPTFGSVLICPPG